MPAPTPNKDYTQQATGANVNVWGEVCNAVFGTVDTNLGGRLTKTLTSGTVGLTTTETANVYHTLDGSLSGNVIYQFPAKGGFWFVNDTSTHNGFTVTIICQGGTGFAIQQNSIVILFINPDTLEAVPIAGNGLTVYPYRVVSTNDDIELTDYYIFADATAGPISINLPNAAASAGRRFAIIKIDATFNAITLGGTINGTSGWALPLPFNSMVLFGMGSGFYVESQII